jgi:hypothetical protein
MWSGFARSVEASIELTPAGAVKKTVRPVEAIIELTPAGI